MKKFIFMMIAMFTLAIGANAQTTVENTNVAGQHSKATDNLYYSATGGIQTNLFDWNAPQGAIAGLEIGKQITPIFGISAEVGMGVNNRRNWYSGAEHLCNGTAIDQIYTFANGHINFMNAFCGYKGKPRKVEVDGTVGVGYGHGYASDASGVPTTDALLGKLGVNINVFLTNNRAWALTIRPAVIWNISATGQFDCRYAVGQLTAGIVYYGKTSNGTHHFVEPVTPLPVVKEVTKEVPVVKEVTKTVQTAENTYAVSFAQNSAELSPEAKATLDKVPTTATVNIAGSTSPEGTAQRNAELAQERADAVAEYLKARGVKVNTVTGGEAGRAAVVTVQ